MPAVAVMPVASSTCRTASRAKASAVTPALFK